MQMRKMYYTVDRKRRAAELRRDGSELGKAGFQVLSEVAYAEAMLLDPPEVVRDTQVSHTSQDKDETGRVKGSGSERVTNNGNVNPQGANRRVRSGSRSKPVVQLASQPIGAASTSTRAIPSRRGARAA